jgi:hypothetical protein
MSNEISYAFVERVKQLVGFVLLHEIACSISDAGKRWRFSPTRKGTWVTPKLCTEIGLI